MNAPRKVFVASNLTQDAINQTFEWPEGFEKTTELEDAEFIVFDLVNIPDDWVGYPWAKPAIYVPQQNLPILFVALEDNIARQFDDIRKYFKSVDLPVYRSPAELFNALQWLQSIFPFYNQTRTADIDKAAAHITVGTLKTREQRS